MTTSSPPRDTAESSWANVLTGDPDGFGRLYDTYRLRVFWHALRHTRALHDAEDITALVFLEAWRKRTAIRLVDGSPLPWLLATTNNVARDVDRSRRRHQLALGRLPEPSHQEDFSDAAGERIDTAPRREAIRSAFAGLAARDQDVLSLCVIAEMPIAEAARVLGVPVGTVKSRLSRAKVKLATLITDLTADAATDGGAR
ncbi:sigma-70 family RNA polymerase sigma factor [Rathayibacter sp. VKM Ac-2759]|uniref:RNA polymerase sigma factor n=1 Tax=Rathayibacter sp. VKM Ac-2759 TaxID=2609252 RepID=UPI001318F47F|nr:RNA polymerase sigma factor [Rathayibacter sp. VKM Ac-2759]QHC67562.1 sigma-70 family RNA polymerase sigma factor [Rathayibacter sp. VKM Ac-2759]